METLRNAGRSNLAGVGIGKEKLHYLVQQTQPRISKAEEVGVFCLLVSLFVFMTQWCHGLGGLVSGTQNNLCQIQVTRIN